MPAETYGLGDMVWSRVALQNDGSIPDLAENAQLAAAGARGVIVKVGSIEEQPEIPVFLVRFEDADAVLGPPVGCLKEELTQDEELARTLRSATEPASTPAAPPSP